MAIEILKQRIDKFVNANGDLTPLAILVSDLDTRLELKRYMESLPGVRHISDSVVSGLSQYFDSKGDLVSDIAQKQQLLADGTKYNAADYLECRVNDYNKPEYKCLFSNEWGPTPDMLGVSRYIAQKTGKRLVVIAPPPQRGQDELFSAFDVVVFK